MTTPIERGAEGIRNDGHWDLHEHSRKRIARAVFESINRDELKRFLWDVQITRPEDPAEWPDHYADAIIAWLLSEGGES